MRILGITGWSGSGKTTLLTRLLPVLVSRGCRVATLKHAHHAFDVDTPGKDSWRHREAGASEVLVASSRRWALVHELRDAPEPGLADLLRKLSPCDLVLVEGWKHASHPKLEVYRREVGKAPLWPTDPRVVAVATDGLVDEPVPARLIHLDDVEGVAECVLAVAQPLDAVLAILDRTSPPG